MVAVLEMTTYTEPFVHLRDKDIPMPENLTYGNSPLEVIPDINRNKSTRKLSLLLQKCIDDGILNEHSQIGETGLIHNKSGLAFVDVTNPEGDYYVHGKVMSLDKNGLYQTTNSPENLDVHSSTCTDIVTGPCLFTVAGVRGIDIHGRSHYITVPTALDNIDAPLQKIEIDPTIQPYEADSILRLSRFISQLNQSRDTTLSLNVPRIEYWFYTMDLYRRGLIDDKLMFDWFEAVNTRSSGIENLLVKRVPQTVEIRDANPLDICEQHILEEVQKGNRHSIFETTRDLLASQDDLWAYLIESTNPDEFADLGYASYMHVYLDRIQDTNSLIVSVENPEESKILDTVKRVVDNAPGKKGAQILGLYPHPNMVIHPKTETVTNKNYLYFYQPENKQGLRRDLRNIFVANNGIRKQH